MRTVIWLFILLITILFIAWLTLPPDRYSRIVSEEIYDTGADARKAIKECLEIPDLSTSVTINQQGDPVILYTITCRSHHD